MISNNNIILFFKNYFDFFFKYFMSFFGLNFPIKIVFQPMTHLGITSSFIARYLSIRLKQRYRLMQALGPVLSDLKKNPLIEGYRINASGRFTKKEIAFYEWFRFGSVPTSTLNCNLDFSVMPFVLKYSLCCFKVWINFQSKKLSLEQIKRYFFKDFIKIRFKIRKRVSLKYFKILLNKKDKYKFFDLFRKKNNSFFLLNKFYFFINKMPFDFYKKTLKSTLLELDKKCYSLLQIKKILQKDKINNIIMENLTYKRNKRKFLKKGNNIFKKYFLIFYKSNKKSLKKRLNLSYFL
jgi:hypothetical protein